MSIDDAITSLLPPIAKELDFKYYKSKRCLKKKVKNLEFVLDLYSNKWNKSEESIEVNVGFHIYNKDVVLCASLVCAVNAFAEATDTKPVIATEV